MKYTRHITALIICVALLLVCGCGNSREDEEPGYTNTSQINLYISPEGSGNFTTNKNYLINMSRGQVLIYCIVISGEEHEHEDDHEHSCTGRHEEVDEAGECHFHGTHAINLLKSTSDLGFENTNPGTYNYLRMEFYGENQVETVSFEGIAVTST